MKTKRWINFSDACELIIREASPACCLNETWHHKGSCSPFSRLYYIKEGEGYLNCNGKETKMRGGYVYFIPAECRIDYGCTRLEKVFFHISVKTPDNYDLFSNINQIFELPFDLNFYPLLLELCQPESYQDILRLKTLLLNTLMEFQETYDLGNVPIQQYSDVVKNTFEYIHDNLKINLKSADIAESLFVSESKLRNSFKAEMQMPIGQYIEDMVFIKAKKLLEDSRLSINEISALLGFYDRFHFSRRFKDKFNQSPGEYKKGIRLGV